MNTKADGDRIAKELVSESMKWFETDLAKLTVNQGITFLKKLIDQLMQNDLSKVKAKDQSQMAAYIGKLIDQIARLVQFSAGQPDTRTEITIASLLPHLNDEEFAIFNRAIERWEQGQVIGVSELSRLN